MPKVQIVDLKTEACPYGVFYLSQTLFTALAENLKAKKQSIIFLGFFLINARKSLGMHLT